jgi:hypothetical protein
VRVAPAPVEVSQNATDPNADVVEVTECTTRPLTFKGAASRTVLGVRMLSARPSSRQVMAALQREDDDILDVRGVFDTADPLDQLLDDFPGDSEDSQDSSDEISKGEPERKASEEDAETRYHKVYYLMLDALRGQDKHGLVAMSEKGPLHLSIFKLRHALPIRWGFIIMVIMHAGLVYIEDNPKYNRLSITLNFLFVTLYSIDMSLKAWQMTFRSFLNKRWNRFTLLFVLLFLTDAVCLALSVIQPFRMLRPWMVLTRERELRRLAQALASKHFYAPLLQLLLGIFLFVLVFAAVGVHVFARDYAHTCQSDSQAYLQGGFDNVLIAMVHMFTLGTIPSLSLSD